MPSPGSLLLALALLVIVGIYVLRPLLSASAPAASRRAPGRRETLESEKEAILAQIRIIDFDHETGTLPDEDYEQLRARLVAAAANVLRERDALEPVAPAAAAELDEIEAAVAQRRRQRVGADIEAAVAQRRAQPQPEAVAVGGNGDSTSSRLFCPQCGQAAVKGDRFCAYCGQQLD
jgi:hypothetical protein